MKMDHFQLNQRLSWPADALEPEQLSENVQQRHYGKKQLSPGAKILFWALRVYALFMLALVTYQAWNNLH